MDLKLLCRICLNNSNSCSNIYAGLSSDENPIYEVINYVYDLEISIDDGLPEHVCEECFCIIKGFEKFKRKAHRAKNELMLLWEKNNVFIKKEEDDFTDSTDAQVSEDGCIHEPQIEVQENWNFENKFPKEECGGISDETNTNDPKSMCEEGISADAGSPLGSEDENCGSVNYVEYHGDERINPSIKEEPRKGMKIVKTQRGRDKIVLNGFMYRLGRKHRDRCSWRCCVKFCNGRLSTPLLYLDAEAIEKGDHCHPPDDERAELAVAVDKIVHSALVSNDPPKKLISSVTGSLSSEVSVEAIRRKIQRKRSRNEKLSENRTLVKDA